MDGKEDEILLYKYHLSRGKDTVIKELQVQEWTRKPRKSKIRVKYS